MTVCAKANIFAKDEVAGSVVSEAKLFELGRWSSWRAGRPSLSCGQSDAIKSMLPNRKGRDRRPLIRAASRMDNPGLMRGAKKIGFELEVVVADPV